MKRISMMLAFITFLLTACAGKTSADVSNQPAALAPESDFGVETGAGASSSAEPVEIPDSEEPEAEAAPTQAPLIPKVDASLGDTPDPPELSNAAEPTEFDAPEDPQLYVEINGQRFSVTLDHSPTAEAFRELLPATWEMEELHGNEKFIYLDGSLPSDSRSVGYIETGDLMLYGGNCVVLFYDSFSTSYGYTRIGWVDDSDGLAEAVGGGDVTVEFGLA